jgi:hypothetical protein
MMTYLDNNEEPLTLPKDQQPQRKGMLMCPFCATVTDLTCWRGYGDYWYVECEICRAQGPLKPSRDEAIAAWNDRI